MPGLGRQPPIEALPGLAGIARAKHCRFALDARPGPYRPSIHWHDPNGVVVLRMACHRKANVSNFFGHIVADPLPSLLCGMRAVAPVEAINAAMVLVIP